MNFPFLDGDVPRSPSYGAYISQHVRLLGCPVMSMTLKLVIKFRQQNFLDKNIDIIIFVWRFEKFIGGILIECLNIMSD